MSDELNLFIKTIYTKYREKNGFDDKNHERFKRVHPFITNILSLAKFLGYISITILAFLYIFYLFFAKPSTINKIFFAIIGISFFMSVTLLTTQLLYDRIYSQFIRENPDIIDKFALFTKEILTRLALQDDKTVDFLIAQLNIQNKSNPIGKGLLITFVVSLFASLISRSIPTNESPTVAVLLFILLATILLVSRLFYVMYSKLPFLKINKISLALNALCDYKIYITRHKLHPGYYNNRFQKVKPISKIKQANKK